VLEEFERLDGLPILGTIPLGVVITEAWRSGRTVVDYAPDSEHAQAYRALAKTLAGGVGSDEPREAAPPVGRGRRGPHGPTARPSRPYRR
jgi:nitrogenase subunit NifH